MKFAAILITLLILSVNNAGADTFVAQIKDADGFTNLRLRPDSDAPIVGRLNREEKFFVSTSQSLDNPDWLPATTGQSFGFIHKSRVNLIEQSKDALILVGRSLTQWIRTGVEEPVGAFFTVEIFKKENHKLTFNPKGALQFINGHDPFGVDGDIPTRKFNDFSIFFAGKKLNVDPKWYQDCYQVELNKGNLSLKVSQSGKEILLSLDASSGSGAYTATWIVERTGKVSRVITYP